jgi:sugar phosphate isomerase/epimerase
MEYGVQLYSVRDITGSNMGGALSSVAQQGYSFVEFAGFFGIGAKEITAMLKEFGLKVSGTHTGLAELVEKTEETIAYHKQIGNTNIIVPYAELDTQQKLDAFIGSMNGLQKKLKGSGIRLGYHNHAHEFKQNADGSVAFEQLIYRTELDLEIDTFWVYAAGLDPVKVLERLHDRVPVIHIKDGYQNGEGMPLGKGTAPVKAVYETAKKYGIPMVVESETLKPSGLAETDICIKYLRSLE